MQRRCLVADCGCRGYAKDLETYDPGDEEFRAVDRRSERTRLCTRCGHPEEEHELAASDA
ncbi:MAG: hypothetical protein ACRD1N_04605 [Terriglobia bacterium]